MKLIQGQLIHRRYRLDSLLAKGGMGEVWKGYDIQLARPVAIKALRTDTSDLAAKLQRLRAEAHNSADLAHPNITALFEYYENDGIGFLVMEYVPSKSLADLFKEQGAIEPTRLLPILIQTARGLYVAHSHGVIHRDVKPANIMVSEEGDVKITDFGVSYSTNQEQITQDGMVVGTAQYISPEQAQGQIATQQSDIYAMGVVAYEGLSGHRPFTGVTPVDIAAAHVNDPVPPLPDSIDMQLNQFIMSMLAKDPCDRPQDALVVSRTLARIQRRLLDEQTNSFELPAYSSNTRVGRMTTSAMFGWDLVLPPSEWMVHAPVRVATTVRQAQLAPSFQSVPAAQAVQVARSAQVVPATQVARASQYAQDYPAASPKQSAHIRQATHATQATHAPESRDQQLEHIGSPIPLHDQGKEQQP